MCGITGFYDLAQSRSRAEMHIVGKNMTEALAHRGPDAHSVWQDPDRPLLLGHRRLSIIDLSADGAQPMASASGRYVIAYNGEIYNFPKLKNTLEAHSITFKGRSDTEVLLAAIEYWGLNQTLQKLSGMFAFALWDRKTGELHFARDRIGKKPLYIGWAGQSLCFTSELKAFYAHPDFKAKLHTAALTGFLQHGYVQAPYCIFEQCWQLPPGHRLTIDTSTLKAGENMAAHMVAYWNAADVLEQAKAHQSPKDDAAVIDEFEALLLECVRDRMLSDVPLGAFLSGGIDSSSVVALMQKSSTRPIKTYAIGFGEDGFNEAGYAKKIAAHLGTDHHEHICSAQDALNVIPKLVDMFDEPFADISAIPTYLVSAFARRDVTVALSGDGGDEMLGGYARHVQGPRIWKKMRLMPRIVRAGLSSALQQMPVKRLDSLNPKHPQWGTKLHKVASILSLDTQEEIYNRLTQKWPQAPLQNPGSAAMALYEPNIELSFAEKMMFWDTVSYLPHDILTKVDRASMACSLEARAPLLDTRIFEYVWQLPQHFKIRDGQGKWLLRAVLERHIPQDLYKRPKQGFSIPVGEWLRGPLKDWAEDLLDEKTLKAQGILDYKAIRRTWQAHLDGQGNHADALWVVLMFQAWHKRWM